MKQECLMLVKSAGAEFEFAGCQVRTRESF